MVRIIELGKKEFEVDKCRVGFILRGKPIRYFDKVLPEEDPIHTDCILPEGHIAGYAFCEDDFENSGRCARSTLKYIDGKISLDQEIYKYYWDTESAKKRGVLSTFLLISVQRRQARAFSDYWYKLRERAPSYNRIFKNCSTLCYEGFKSAEILQGIFHPITPLRLYHALIKKYSSEPNANLITKTGYFGINQEFLKINLIEINIE